MKSGPIDEEATMQGGGWCGEKWAIPAWTAHAHTHAHTHTHTHTHAHTHTRTHTHAHIDRGHRQMALATRARGTHTIEPHHTTS